MAVWRSVTLMCRQPSSGANSMNRLARCFAAQHRLEPLFHQLFAHAVEHRRRLLKARILLKADVSESGPGWSDSQIIAALDTSSARLDLRTQMQRKRSSISWMSCWARVSRRQNMPRSLRACLCGRFRNCLGASGQNPTLQASDLTELVGRDEELELLLRPWSNGAVGVLRRAGLSRHASKPDAPPLLATA
jgi:hypothetical protein